MATEDLATQGGRAQATMILAKLDRENSMMTSSNGIIFRVTGHLCGEFTGEFPAQRPVTRSYDVFFDPSLNKRLSKQSWVWWFETPPRPLWRQCNVVPRMLRVDVLVSIVAVDALGAESI